MDLTLVLVVGLIFRRSGPVYRQLNEALIIPLNSLLRGMSP
jgi:hypothetical protein